MNNHEKYTTKKTFRARWLLIFLLAAIAAAGIGWTIGNAVNAGAEDQLATCWILCKPGTQVNVRIRPDKDSEATGWLEVGDSFLTDGETKNGFVHVLNVGENTVGWVYCGYVVTEEPKPVMENYVCVARHQAACRRWVQGPQVKRFPWLKNGSCVTVFWMNDEWAVTSRGYIQSEWLEADPE